MTDRHVFRLTGADRVDFLQGLVTNDVTRAADELVYAALLTPQGKYLADFFLKAEGDALLLDAARTQAQSLQQRLTLYKLRADVEITDSGLHVWRGLGTPPEDGQTDPRHPALGWRAYRPEAQEDDATDWTALHVRHLIPQVGAELHADTYILEAGFERLNGVDFRKGCYVGQEVTARMKHKTELRKGLARVSLSAPVPVGTSVTTGAKDTGMIHTTHGTDAIAYLRFDRVTDDTKAGDATVTLLER